MRNGSAPGADGDAGDETRSVSPIGGGVGGVGLGQETQASKARNVSLEGARSREAQGRSNTRFARAPVAARVTESGPAETTSPGTSSPSVSAEVDYDEFAVVVPLAARSEVEASPYRPIVDVDTGV